MPDRTVFYLAKNGMSMILTADAGETGMPQKSGGCARVSAYYTPAGRWRVRMLRRSAMQPQLEEPVADPPIAAVNWKRRSGDAKKWGTGSTKRREPTSRVRGPAEGDDVAGT